MNSISRKLPTILTAAVVALALVGVVLYQSGLITDLQQTLLNKNKELILVSQELNEQTSQLEVLQHRVKALEDSVAMLQAENLNLIAKVETQKRTIEKLSLSIKKQEDQVKVLTKEINRLKVSGKDNELKIKELVSERDKLLLEMEEQDKQRIAAEAERKKNETAQIVKQEQVESVKVEQQKVREQMEPMPMVPPTPMVNLPPDTEMRPVEKAHTSTQATISERKQERIEKIMRETELKFSGVTFRNRENGNNLKAVKDDWRYAFLEFDLKNLDPEIIVDEQFVIQLFDLDNQSVVPFNERNMKFPDSQQGAGGLVFKYDGKPMTVRYHNTQKKEGRNYEVRLYYMDRSGVHYQLAKGVERIVTDGEVIFR